MYVVIRSLSLALALLFGAAPILAKPLDGWIYINTNKNSKYYMRILKEAPNDPQVIAEIRVVDNEDDITQPFIFDCTARKMGQLKNRFTRQTETWDEVSDGTLGERWFSAACIAKSSSAIEDQWMFLISNKDLKYYMRVIKKDQKSKLAIAEIKITEPKAVTIHRTLFDCSRNRYGILKTGSSSNVEEWQDAPVGSLPGSWLFKACQ